MRGRVGSRQGKLCRIDATWVPRGNAQRDELSKPINIFRDNDDFLSGVDRKTDEKSELAHDSFVCCLLSNSDKSCIFSSDSEKIHIDHLESHGS